MALGFCDYGYCAPRENPYFPPGSRFLSVDCPREGLGGSYIVNNGTFRGQTFGYDAARFSNANGMRETMRELVRGRLCELSDELLEPSNDPGKFEVSNPGYNGEDCYLENITIGARPADSKKLKHETVSFDTRLAPLYPEPNQAGSMICPYEWTLGSGLAQQHRFGMYRNPANEISFPENSVYGAESCGGQWPGTVETLQCTEVNEIDFVIVFEEKDLNYKVNKSRPLYYSIKTVTIGFTPFNPNYDFGSMDASCALIPGTDSPPERCNEAGWTCYTPVGADGCYAPQGA